MVIVAEAGGTEELDRHTGALGNAMLSSLHSIDSLADAIIDEGGGAGLAIGAELGS